MSEVLGSEEEEFVEDPLLKVKGVTPQLAAALRDAGYFSIESIAIEPPHILFENVGERAGFSLKKAQEITAEARKHLKVKFLILEELEKEEARRQVISTNCSELDGLLGGGNPHRRTHGGQRPILGGKDGAHVHGCAQNRRAAQSRRLDNRH